MSSFEQLAATVEIDPGDRGISVPASGFRGDVLFVGSRGAQNAYSIRAASASRLLQAGLNVSFFEFNLPSLEPWLRSFASEVGISFQDLRLYAFAAPQGNKEGTDPHWDPNEVIQVQLQGTKVMQLAPNAHAVNPDIGLRSGVSYSEDLLTQFRDDPPLQPPKRWQTVTLRPGSAIYFPRGYWHQTLTRGPSFAVTFGFYWPTAYDVATSYLRARLRQYAAWRQPQFGILKASSRRAHMKNLEDLMHRFGISPATFPPAHALSRAVSPDLRITEGGENHRYARMPFSMSARRRQDGSVAVRISTDRGYSSFDFLAPRALFEAVKWIADRRASFTLSEVAMVADKASRSDLESLLATFIDFGAVQFDSRQEVTSRPRQSRSSETVVARNGRGRGSVNRQSAR